jgi:hypothetical protein
MVSLQDMASSYTEQLRYRVQEAEEQLVRMKQHLQECENEIQFGGSSPFSFGESQESSTCDSTGSAEGECCNPAEDPIATVSMPLPSIDNADTNK